MPKKTSLWSVFYQELFSFVSIFWILIFAFSYVLFTIFVLNYRLVIATTNSFPLLDKITVLVSLVVGIFTAFSPLDSVLILTSAVLVGINSVLIGKTVYVLGHSGSVKMSVGGATIISLVSAGCTSCGFSLLSVVGFGSAFSSFPFQGMGVHFLSLLFLLFSAFYMVKKLRDSTYCLTR